MTWLKIFIGALIIMGFGFIVFGFITIVLILASIMGIFVIKDWWKNR